MHLPLFVLLHVLLKVKQKFKHEGVISVRFAWVILAFAIHLLRLVFACFGFNFIFEPFNPKCMDKECFLRPS